MAKKKQKDVTVVGVFGVDQTGYVSGTLVKVEGRGSKALQAAVEDAKGALGNFDGNVRFYRAVFENVESASDEPEEVFADLEVEEDEEEDDDDSE